MTGGTEGIVNTFLDWAVLDKDYLTQVPSDDPDAIFDLIPEFLDSRGTDPQLRLEAARVLAEKLYDYRATLKEQPPGENPGWMELMRRAALGGKPEEESNE